MNTTLSWSSLSLCLCLVACGETETTPTDGAAGGSHPGAGGALSVSPPGKPAPDISCAEEPEEAAFVFKIHNSTGAPIEAERGCSTDLPIGLSSGNAQYLLNASHAEACGYLCSVLTHQTNNGCSDCGPTVWTAILPDETLELAWNQLAYESSTAPEGCWTGEGSSDCALATRVPPDVSEGLLGYCASERPTSSCLSLIHLAFTLDLSAGEALIDVK